MQVTPEICSQLVHLLYSAMPQVVSSTLATVLLATIIWWRIPSGLTAAFIAVAAMVVIIRTGILLAYRWKNAGAPAPPLKAVVWERLYGIFSIVMALLLSAVTLTAFVLGDSGTQLVSSGAVIGICGGQSTTRVTCRPWIPIASGSILMGALTVCAFLWGDPLASMYAVFTMLYLYTYIEACRHGAWTILGRLVAESELASLARRDALTGLANRMGFEETLERALHSHRRNRNSVSLLMLDLDGFKAVNDELGHPAGDAVLREVADRLRRLSRCTDHVARLGGDEFAVVVTDHHDQESMSDYARRLIAAISEPIDISGKLARIGVSIGIGMVMHSGVQEPAGLLAATDTALYTVKKGSKNDFAFAAPVPGLS